MLPFVGFNHLLKLHFGVWLQFPISSSIFGFDWLLTVLVKKARAWRGGGEGEGSDKQQKQQQKHTVSAGAPPPQTGKSVLWTIWWWGEAYIHCLDGIPNWHAGTLLKMLLAGEVVKAVLSYLGNSHHHPHCLLRVSYQEFGDDYLNRSKDSKNPSKLC